MNLNYDLILKITESFYDVAKRDILIGYHFRVIDDFDEHIPRIADFWHLQLNGKVTNKANLPFDLLKIHKPLKINRGEIGRWVKLFTDNLDQYLKTNEITPADKEAWLKKVNLFKEKLEFFLFS